MRIGAYETVSELGRGGMGVVFRARSTDGREVAVKVLLKVKPDSLARFERERRLLALFGESEGFVPLLDQGSSQEGPFFVMPLLAGGSLRERLERGPLGVEEAIALARALAEAVARAHDRGIVHRDLKPENVLFAKDGRPLLADLGLAKHFLRDAPDAARSVSLSQADTMRGTFGYAAPEQLQDSKSVGPAADVFSLGAIVYECLAGRPAFAGENILELSYKVVHGELVPLRELRRDVPAFAASAVERALSSDPSRRFESARAFAAALAGERRRSRLVPILAGVAVLAALAVSGFVLFPREKEPPAPTAPTTPTAAQLVSRGKARLDRMELAPAIADFTRALELDPRSADAHVYRGEARYKNGDREGSIADASLAIQIDPKSVLAWSHRGSARCDKGDNDGAIADLTRAVELDPTFHMAWRNRGRARSNKGDVDGAIADWTRTIELHPKDGFAQKLRGMARRKRGELALAIEDFSRWAELDSRNGVAWATLADALVARGSLDDAIADFTRAIAADPKLAAAWVGRGSARLQNGDREGAKADLRRFLELAPDGPGARGAREELERLERADAGSPDGTEAAVLAARGEERLNKGDTDGAIADLSRAIESEPKNEVAWRNRGKARAKKNDFEGAIADLGKAIELRPLDKLAWTLRAAAKNGKDDFEGSAEDYTKVIELDAKYPYAYFGRGDALASRNRFVEAIADFDRAIELDPKLAPAWASRGFARVRTGALADARSDLLRFLELAPSDAHAPEARSVLAKLERGEK